MSWLVFLAALALAQDEVDTGAPAEDMPTVEEPPADAPVLSPEDLANAEQLEDLSAAELRAFVPNRGRLPQNPNAQVDFTAYTLEWGEVRIGLQQVAVGILPLTQIGTSIPWNLMGIPNGQLKVTVVPWDPIAVGIAGHVYAYPRQTYQALQYGATAKVSVRAAKPWSLHFGYTWQHIQSSGDFDVTDLPPIWFGIDDDGSFQLMRNWEDDTIPVLEDFYLNGDMMTADFATDVRFNRRDSLIFQLRYIFWGVVDSPAVEYLPDILYFDDLLRSDGFIDFQYTYSFSLSYQLAWRNVEVRAGVGWSGIPGAFLFQAFDAAYRFGGPTRLKEARMKQTWRRNKREARERSK